MLDIKWIRENPEALDAALAKRGAEPLSASLIALDQKRRSVAQAMQDMQSRRNSASKEIGAAMAQKNVTFTPGTLIVAKGGSVAFPNLDTVRHSVFSFSKAARFEIDLYGRDQSRSQAFPVVGTVALGCNIHDQMRGYIRVVDTPYAAKTDQNGLVRLSGMAAGTYQLTIWHPRARTPGGEVKRAVVVGAGAASQKIALRLR